MALTSVRLNRNAVPALSSTPRLTRTSSYLLSFLDRTNIGNARLAGMEADLGMAPSDYNLALTVFFISYAVFEPATNALLKRLTPRIFFTGIIVVWGIIMTLMGLCHNTAGLLAARWFLGIAEAGLFPGKLHPSCAPPPRRHEVNHPQNLPR